MSRAHTHHDPSRPSASAAPASSGVAAAKAKETDCGTPNAKTSGGGGRSVCSVEMEGRAKDDGSWINTPARTGQRAPQNTPWRGGGGEATEATDSPPISQPSLVTPLDIVQDISTVSAASAGDSESTVGSVLRLAGRGLVSGHLRGAFASAAPALHRNLRGAFTAQSADGAREVEGRQGALSGAPIAGNAPAGAGSKAGSKPGTHSGKYSLACL
jgi:hypothetical protein